MADREYADRKPRIPDPEDLGPKEPPLAQPRIQVARFKRVFPAMLIAALAGGTVLALFRTMESPKGMGARSASAGEPAKVAASLQPGGNPQAAEAITSAPGSYSENQKHAARPSGSVPAKEPFTPAWMAAALPLPPQTTWQGGASGQLVQSGAIQFPAQLSPGQQALLQQVEQAKKDAQEASRSPLVFGNGREFAAPKSAASAIPGVPGADRLETLAARIGKGSGADSAAEDQNLQDEKRRFAVGERRESPYLDAVLQSPVSPYEIKAGTILPGTLITGINSDLPGQIVAQLRENVFDTVTGRFVLLPQGTRLIGEYDSKVAYGQERVLVVWSRLILPTGQSISLEGMPGVDLSGYAGAAGRVNNHFGKLMTGVVLGSVIGAGAQIATGGQGSPNTPPNFGQLAVAGAATNINQAGQQFTQKNLNLQPTIEVPPGQKINIFVTKDIVLKPFLHSP